MPYASDAQRRFFHSPAAKKAGISDKTVEEYDKSSEGLKLPRHVNERAHFHKFVKDKVKGVKR